MAFGLQRTGSELSLDPESPKSQGFVDLPKDTKIDQVAAFQLWKKLPLGLSTFKQFTLALPGKIKSIVGGSKPAPEVTIAPTGEVKVKKTTQPIVNRTKLQAHASIASDSVYLITRAEGLATSLDPKFSSEVSLLSSLNFFTGSIGIIDATEQFYKKVKVKYILGAGDALARGFKSLADVLSGFTGTMIAVDKVAASFQVKTAISVNNVALKTLKTVNNYASVASSSLSLVSSTTYIVRTLWIALGLTLAKTHEDKLKALGLANFDKMTPDQKEAAIMVIKDLSGVKLTKEQLEAYVNQTIDTKAQAELESKIFRGSMENFGVNLFSAVVSTLSLVLSIGDKLLGGFVGTALEITYLTLSGLKFGLDVLNIYRSNEASKEGKNDHYFHMAISIFFSAVALAGLITASVTSAGAVPLALMIIAIVGPILVNAIVHVSSDPKTKAVLKSAYESMQAFFAPKAELKAKAA